MKKEEKTKSLNWLKMNWDIKSNLNQKQITNENLKDIYLKIQYNFKLIS